jgi:hypothetical protein
MIAHCERKDHEGFERTNKKIKRTHSEVLLRISVREFRMSCDIKSCFSLCLAAFMHSRFSFHSNAIKFEFTTRTEKLNNYCNCKTQFPFTLTLYREGKRPFHILMSAEQRGSSEF